MNLSATKVWVAVQAREPLVRVTTDDLSNLVPDLSAAIAPLKLTEFKSAGVSSAPASLKLPHHLRPVYWTTDTTHATAKMAEKMAGIDSTLIVVTDSLLPANIAFDAGPLPFNAARFKATAEELPMLDHEGVFKAVQGLSTTETIRTLRFAQIRHDAITPDTVRRTRGWLGGSQKGLIPLSNELGPYIPAANLVEWCQINLKYFKNTQTNPHLVPRGLLFDGPPGTGKTMAAKYIAARFEVPLYRLDLATTLDKYIGVSEQRMADTLSRVEREAPCVLLIDEAEKAFAIGDNDSVPARLMSQLLWWLQEKTAHVLVVITTNDKNKLPPELYREGRIDKTFDVLPLESGAAKQMARYILENILPGVGPLVPTFKKSWDAIEKELNLHVHKTVTPAQVKEIVVESVKTVGF